MAESLILAERDQIAQPMCVYRCDSGGIHIRYGYVSLAMTRVYFQHFTQLIRDTILRIHAKTWERPGVMLNYGSTSLVISVDEFVDFAAAVLEAEQALESVAGLCETSDPAEEMSGPSLDEYRLN